MASVLDGLKKQMNKKYEKAGIDMSYYQVAQVGVPKDKYTSTFSLGSPSLDFMTYNSIPEGIFIEISGKEASGKTTLAFKIASDFIRKEKQKDIDKRRHIMFVDAEGTADPDWALTSSGYDMNDTEIETLYETPLGQSAEQIFDDVKDAVESGKIGLVIFDSLVAVAGQQTSDESMTKKDMGGIAKVLADFTKRYTGLFKRYRVTFIGINGIIMNISGYGNPETTPGGEYWRRACSLRLRTKRGAFIDENGNELKSTAESPAGHIIEVALLKTKFCRWDRKLGRCHLNYTRGIDILQDTIELATYFKIIQSPSQGYFIVTDPDTGEVLTEKIHGQSNIRPYFEQHPDIWKRVYDKVYELLSIKGSPNSLSFEKMLNVNVDELFNMDLSKEEE